MDTLNTPLFNTHAVERLKKSKSHLTWASVAMILTGMLSIVFPMISTFTLSVLVGSLLMVGGGVAFFTSFSLSGTGPFFGSLLLSLLQFASGLIIFNRPEIGALVLTLMIAMVFMFEGAFSLAYAFEIKPAKGWGWMLFSAVIAIFAGFVLISALPGAALWFVGLMFGINFLSTGLSGLMLARCIPKN